MIGRRPYAAFGNSTGDRQMLEWTKAGGGARLKMLVLHDDAAREYAYGPAARACPTARSAPSPQALYDEAKKNGWTVISMKNDWKASGVVAGHQPALSTVIHRSRRWGLPRRRQHARYGGLWPPARRRIVVASVDTPRRLRRGEDEADRDQRKNSSQSHSISRAIGLKRLQPVVVAARYSAVASSAAGPCSSRRAIRAGRAPIAQAIRTPGLHGAQSIGAQLDRQDARLDQTRRAAGARALRPHWRAPSARCPRQSRGLHAGARHRQGHVQSP